MPAPPEIFAAIYRRHGHRCPMSTLGGRLGLAARRALAGAEALRAVYFIRTCAVDGVAATTGCREEDGSLQVKEEGAHRLQLLAGREVVTVSLRPAALEIAGRYRRASDALQAGLPGLTDRQRRERATELQETLDEVLQALWTLPDDALLQLRRDAGTAEAR